MGASNFPRVRTLLVAGSRVRPAVLGGRLRLCLSSGLVSPRTRSDYFAVDIWEFPPGFQ